MTGKKILFTLLFALFAIPFSLIASNESNNESALEGKDKTKSEIKAYINHHLEDSYDFSIWHAAGIEFPLPIILIDEGLQVFSSSKFHHGKTLAEHNGNFYKVYHNKIYKTDVEGTISIDPETNHPEQTKPLNFSITKNVMSIFLFGLLMFFIFRSVAKSYGEDQIPNKLGRFIEPLVIFVRDDIAIPNIGEKHYRRFMGYLLTVFFFIWFLNLGGMTPLGIGVTNNLAVTFCLAIITFIITTISGNKSYWGHIFWMPGVPAPMKIILAPIELLGIFIKPFALMIRLFANMTAGHVVMMSLIGLLYIFTNWFARGAFLGLTLFLSIIELLVAFLQAYIFTMLTALYFGGAVAEHDDHH
ncbi:F0F1 ATP synthase subunit A [Vicingaceae bacterium]|nr:F0F1 ATP synthase subunit A [Vicingaceae bacterium]MDB4060794.1 F0F1 ATP synthase subunit A [Vicingaceae bacterium]